MRQPKTAPPPVRLFGTLKRQFDQPFLACKKQVYFGMGAELSLLIVFVLFIVLSHPCRMRPEMHP